MPVIRDDLEIAARGADERARRAGQLLARWQHDQDNAFLAAVKPRGWEKWPWSFPYACARDEADERLRWDCLEREWAAGISNDAPDWPSWRNGTVTYLLERHRRGDLSVDDARRMLEHWCIEEAEWTRRWQAERQQKPDF